MEIEVAQEKQSNTEEVTIEELKEKIKQKDQEIESLNKEIDILKSQNSNQELSIKTFSVGTNSLATGKKKLSLSYEYDIKNLSDNWGNLTDNNFGFINVSNSVTAQGKEYYYGTRAIMSYDNSTGILKITFVAGNENNLGFAGYAEVALFE